MELVPFALGLGYVVRKDKVILLKILMERSKAHKIMKVVN
jgi:hypothetical protein